jgi:glycerophosphoryl diester phosphodiesterase
MLAELQVLDAGSWFGEAFAAERIPTFADVLERYQGQVHIHIELKGRTAHLAQHTADLVRAHGMGEHVTMTSFHKTHLQKMRAYAPELPMGWLVGEVGDEVIAQARELGCTQLCPHANTVRTYARTILREGFLSCCMR